MSLQDVSIKNEYRSLIDNVVQDFYIPLLERAMVYKRAVGFFSSSSLVEITKGIAAMAANGGKIQIVASPYLSEEDIEAIQGMPNVTVSLKELFSVKSLERKSITILCSVSIFWLALLPRVFWTSVLLIRKTKTELVCIMKRWDLLKMRKEI